MRPDTLPIGRRRLDAVVRASGDVIKTEDVEGTLAIGRARASQLLSRWARQDRLRRVGRGAYVPVPAGVLEDEYALDDHWVLVPALFAPAYVGGRTAAEHWDLTEQMYRDIVVMTARPVRRSEIMVHDMRFTLHHVPEEKIFGTRLLRCGSTGVRISDVHRTIIDLLDKPTALAGAQQAHDFFTDYLRHPDRCDERLIEYAERLGNGAVFKRLGFFAERNAPDSMLVDACRARLTKGNARLDGIFRCSRLITRWRLWVPERWERLCIR